MVRHELRRPNLVLWLITIWRRGSQERERDLTLDGRTRGWSNWALGGVPRGPIPPAGRPRPFGLGREDTGGAGSTFAQRRPRRPVCGPVVGGLPGPPGRQAVLYVRGHFDPPSGVPGLTGWASAGSPRPTGRGRCPGPRRPGGGRALRR